MNNDGGPAFPALMNNDIREFSGMSLRQWYASQALQGLLAAYAGHTPHPSYTSSKAHADEAFTIADAMIAHEANHE